MADAESIRTSHKDLMCPDMEIARNVDEENDRQMNIV
jgi:hypothetical protein